MHAAWIRAIDVQTVSAAFVACFVECVEALSVVLAVGLSRGWPPALQGAIGGVVLLAAVVVGLGPTLALIPLHALQLVVGALLMWVGVSWWRKAVRRLAGLIPLRNEAAAFERARHESESIGPRSGADWLAVAATFKAVCLEGLEVVLIVLGLGTAPGQRERAIIGAVLAVASVLALGIALRRPLTRVPQNAMKLVVGSVLVAFGVFWSTSGAGVVWAGGDAVLPLLVFTVLALALLRGRSLRAPAPPGLAPVTAPSSLPGWSFVMAPWVLAWLIGLRYLPMADVRAPLFALAFAVFLWLSPRLP